MHLKYPENIYADGTFYSAPKLIYQLFITHIYIKDINIFITTSFSLLADKQQSTYEKLFEELNNNILNYSDTNTFYPKYCHVDFE